jgi:hypothetical protein
MTKTKKIFWILFLFISFHSCKLHFLNDTSNNRIKNNSEIKRLAMVLLNISNDDGHYSISIVNSKIIETTKKIDDNKYDIWHENDFVCFILDKQKKIIDTLLISQPLHPRFEYPEDDNTIGSKVIEHKNNDVLLKFSYLSTMKYLRIEKVEENNHLRLLDVLDITLIQLNK